MNEGIKEKRTAQVIYNNIEIIDVDFLKEIHSWIEETLLFEEDVDLKSGLLKRDIIFSECPEVLLHLEIEIKEYQPNNDFKITSGRSAVVSEIFLICDDYEADGVITTDVGGDLKEIKINELEYYL